MARLEACYFCGTAEDAPLREVTVTPRRRRDDPDAAVTLTLCPTCEGKLAEVLGGLFDHVESRRTGADEGDADGETPDDAEVPPVDRIDVASGPAGDDDQRGRRRLFTDPPEPAESDEAPDEPAEEDAEIIEDEPEVHARATANAGDGLDGVSVTEYNRVMRLLQNREFPMGRTAFVDLAANAYDLREETVEQVLDTVIDQGSLSERSGELVRPGDEEPA